MATQEQAFKIRWGKLSLALIGALALLAVPVTFVVACFTSLSFLVAPLCAALVVASFVGLRTSAIRDRRRKAWARAESAVPEAEVEEKSRQDEDQDDTERTSEEQSSHEATAETSAAADVSSAGQKVDAESKEAPTEEAFDVEANMPTVTHEDSEEAVDATDAANPTQDGAHADRSVEGAPTGERAEGDEEASSAAEDTAESTTSTKGRRDTWSPRSVPAPTYTTAEPVERHLPAAQPAEEEKKASTVTSIRQAERDRVESERTTASEIAVEVGEEADVAAHAESAKRLDLDAVLQRRRA